MLLRAAGRRRVTAVVCFGLLGMTGAMGIGLGRGIRNPAVHDEFSYLLAADTFAAGRLTNPTHPYWQHFETFHVIHQPTYASKYPPGQGLVLALGQVMVDTPIAGVWLSVGMMTAAVAWMLLSWLPPQWAVLACSFCMVHLGWLSYWGQSYWGGSVAATGGALAFGALRHLSDRPNWYHGSLLGVGLSVMAASRPFEGAIAAVPLIMSCAYFALRRPVPIIRALVPTALITVAALSALAFYNWKITGSIFTMPYQVHQAQYAAAPPLLFMKPKAPPTYRHKEMERYWTEWSTERHLRQQKPEAILAGIPLKIVLTGFTLLGPGIVAAAVGFAAALRRPQFFAILVSLVLVQFASVMTKGSLAHYVAPTLGVWYLVFAVGLWSLHRRARRVQAPNLALFIVVACAAYVLYEIPQRQTDEVRFGQLRASLLHRLEMMPEKSLVVVKYGLNHNYHHEWVYNRADIDSAKVVWARSMGAARDRELEQYFADRAVWTLDVEDGAASMPVLTRNTKP